MYNAHASADTLELYSLGRPLDVGREELENHLLLCEECCARLQDLDQYHHTIRAALLRLRAQETPGSHLRLNARPFLLVPAALAVVALFVVLVVRAPLGRGPAAAYLTVALEASRGLEHSAVVNAGSPGFVLQADLTELAPQPRLTVELVNARGRALWAEKDVTPNQNHLSVSVPRRLSAGLYWVRLYTPDPARELLREYSLRVK